MSACEVTLQQIQTANGTQDLVTIKPNRKGHSFDFKLAQQSGENKELTAIQ